jgi:hypothetical protein
MAPFEVLYGRKCRTPLNWSKTGERSLVGPDIIQQAEEQVRIVREHLKTAQSRQKSNYDRKHQEMVYHPGEQAYLRVTPLKGTHRFGIKGKLAPRYIGPFCILARRGEVAYQLQLPPNISQVHDVFHVSNSVAASRILFELWIMKCLNYGKICLIQNIPSVFLIKLSVGHVKSQSSSSRFSGQIILKMKPLGNARIVFAKNTPLSFSLPLNSRDENS